MRFHQRDREPSQPQQDVQPTDPPVGETADQPREAGDTLFEAADEAIKRALSGDSLKFLHATKQEGGQ